MSASTRSRTVLAAAVLVAGLTACTAGDDDAGPESTPSSTPTGGPLVVGATELEPIVEVTFDVPRGEGDKVTIGLVSLVASGQTTELRVLMTPDFTSAKEDISVYDMFGHDTFAELWDIENLRSYDVISDTGIEFETDVVYAKTSNGKPILYQAWYPFPEGRPETLDVSLHPSWPVIEDVPVTYED